MSRTAKGVFIPKNPGKYVGPRGKDITYRSSWEYSMMQVFDSNDGVLQWASEPFAIKYKNPFKKDRQGSASYIPDFFVNYLDKSGKQIREVIEVKPAKEIPGFPGKTTLKDRAAQAVNAAKWEAAARFCAANGCMFRLMSEDEIYQTAPPSRTRKPSRPRK